MDYLQDASLSQIHPAFPHFKATVKIDCSYSREVIELIGPSSSPVKMVASVDIVLYDEQGTKMVAKLISEESRDHFMWMIHPGLVYEVCNPAVEVGGEGIHEDYHLEFVETTDLRDASGVFPPFPYKIFTVSQLTKATQIDNHLFDLVGFVRYCSPISKMKYNHFWEKEFRLVLDNHNKVSGWAQKEVICVLRGSGLEAQAKLMTPPNNRDTPSLCSYTICYYLRTIPISLQICSGVPVVRSYCDATTLDIDPPIPQVQRLKLEMLHI